MSGNPEKGTEKGLSWMGLQGERVERIGLQALVSVVRAGLRGEADQRPGGNRLKAGCLGQGRG